VVCTRVIDLLSRAASFVIDGLDAVLLIAPACSHRRGHVFCEYVFIELFFSELNLRCVIYGLVQDAEDFCFVG